MNRFKYFLPFLVAALLVIALFLVLNNDNLDELGVSAVLSETQLSEEVNQPLPDVSQTETREFVIVSTETPAIAPQSTEEPTPTTQPEETWEDALYRVSLQFIAGTPDEANQIARDIDFLVGDTEDACNMCGPLSIAILKEAGLLPDEADVHDAWLLCARENGENCFGMETLTKSYFPPDEYEYLRVYDSVRDYDFKSNPLQPGDWLYLYTYIHGYDHMLVVTRVDEQGNPYTVTNVDWGEGFVIEELKLYDVDNPEEGLFYELTKIERRRIGMMGTAGFLLVRKIGGFTEKN